ncbi:ATP-binding protein [Myxococcaceae bacterium GXIMD 01537]
MAPSSRPEFIRAERRFTRSVLAGLALLGLVAVAGPLLSYRSDVNEVRAQFQHRVAREARVYAEALGLHLQLLQSELERVAAGVGPHLELEGAAEEDLLDLTTPKAGLFRAGVVLLDASGRSRWSDPPGLLRQETCADKPWFHRVVSQRRPVVDALAPGSPDFVVAVPVVRGNTLVGVVAGLPESGAAVPGGRPMGEHLDLLVLNHAGDVFLPEQPPAWASAPGFASTVGEILSRGGRSLRLEGRKLYASATQVPGTELVLVLAADETAMLASVRERFLLQLLMVALLQVGTLVLFSVHWRRVYGLFRAVEERATRQDKLAALGSAASLIAHEVKNSLNGLKVATGFLAGQGADALVVRTLSGQVDRLGHLATSLLHFGKPPSARRTLVELPALVREVVEGLRVLPEAEEVRLDVALPERLSLQCDPLLLATALDNLLRNAMEAAVGAKDLGRVASPEVRVRAGTEAGAAWVSVEDNAGGLAPEVEARLFEPFVTSKPKGIGLGLAMTRQALEQQGGSLTHARSTDGSRFTARLPLEETTP